MDVFFDFLEEAGLVIAIIFSSVLIIDIIVRLCTGSVKQLAKLIVLLDNNIKLVRREVKEIRDEVDECATCELKSKSGRCTKHHDVE